MKGIALSCLLLLVLPLSAIAGQNFTPYETPTGVSATTTSSSTSFTLTQAISAPDVKVCNIGSTLAYWTCGNSSAQATVPGSGSTSTEMNAGLCGVYHKGSGSTTCAAITSAGSSTVLFTAGQGN